MAEEQGKKDDEKLEFTPEGETFGYISLDQASVRATTRQHKMRGDSTPLGDSFVSQLVALTERLTAGNLCSPIPYRLLGKGASNGYKNANV